MNSVFQDYSRQNGSDADSMSTAAFAPPVDIYEDAHTIVLNLEAPGMKQDAFDIQVENNTLSVRGERKFEAEQKEENYHRVERRYGSFYRAFTLPQTVDTEQVRASYEAGILRIELAKRAEAKPKQIKVSVGGAQAIPLAFFVAPRSSGFLCCTWNLLFVFGHLWTPWLRLSD